MVFNLRTFSFSGANEDDPSPPKPLLAMATSGRRRFWLGLSRTLRARLIILLLLCRGHAREKRKGGDHKVPRRIYGRFFWNPLPYDQIRSSIIRLKSSKHTNPSPFLSTPSIMRRHSSNVHRPSPIPANAPKSSSAVILPSPSLSKNSKVRRISTSQSGSPPSEPTRLSRSSILTPTPSSSAHPTSLSMSAFSSALSGSAPSPLSRASSSSLERTPSLSPSMYVKARASSQFMSAADDAASDHSPESCWGSTLVGVRDSAPAPGLCTDDAAEELEEEEDDVVAPDPNDAGSSDLATPDRSFLDPKRRFGLSRLILTSFIWGVTEEEDKPGMCTERERGKGKTEKAGEMGLREAERKRGGR
ncbi:Protein kinase domain-containing protein [Psidium guajava]|nr:Protein kinase domain-containing protein [Psidium guajava]